jgi:hypothetical protein
MTHEDEAYDMGKRHMREKILMCTEGNMGTNYALGALTAICCHLLTKNGPRYTYDLLQNLADQAASSIVEQERK